MAHPIDAQKPIDKRKSTSKVARTVVSINDNITEKGRASIANKAEIDSYDTIYSPSDIKALGLTYDTLRYYEKIGLIDPKRNIENGYREFGGADMHNLLMINLILQTMMKILFVHWMAKIFYLMQCVLFLLIALTLQAQQSVS